MNKTTIILMSCITIVSLMGCKKEEQCGVKSGGNGFVPSVDKPVMFWLDHDHKAGKLTITSMVRHKTGQEESYSGWAQILQYYNSQPECGASGVAQISIDKGQQYDYTFTGEDGRTFTGSFATDCTDDCQAVLVQ
ncbi:hypothetical protein [Taibaiella koreensis]|uniref:hypothetical protein n=1 Tax=Taibaiella koreensis TaxID=1268548 RepID=UPI0013C303BF|nr:hypothetical protein [Taibaiella koreensis]